MSVTEAFVYHVRFEPPLQTRHYEHLEERVLVGWILLAERPLPEMAPFSLRRREAHLSNMHRVAVELMRDEDARNVHALAEVDWQLARRFHRRLIDWISKPPRPGMAPASHALLHEHGLLFLPAFAPLPGSSALTGWFSPPNTLGPCGSADSCGAPVDWAAIRTLLTEAPALHSLQHAFARTGTTAAELRRLSTEAVEGIIRAKAAAGEADEQLLCEAAAAAVNAAEPLAGAVARQLVGRVATTP